MICLHRLTRHAISWLTWASDPVLRVRCGRAIQREIEDALSERIREL